MQISPLVAVKQSVKPCEKSSETSENRQSWISDKLVRYLCDHEMLTASSKIVDIGGGEGHVLANIGQAMGIAKDRLVCIEPDSALNTWSEEYTWPHSDSITYDTWNWQQTESEHVMHSKQQVDIVIMMVSLHHMLPEVATQAIQQAHAMLRPCGVLLVKEHDIDSPERLIAVDWEHHLYHLVETTETDKEDLEHYLAHRYVANYRSKREWNDLFGSCNFTLMDERTRLFEPCGPVDTKNATNMYWQVWRK